MKTIVNLCAIQLLTLTLQLHAQNYETNGAYVETFVGSGIPGFLDGQGQQTKFNDPTQIVADSTGNLYVYDNGNAAIRMITQDGVVSTLISVSGYYIPSMAIDHSNNIWTAQTPGGGIYYFDIYSTNGSLLNSTNLGFPVAGMCFDSSDNLYFSSSCVIYRYSSATGLHVFAGAGFSGIVDGIGVFSEFIDPATLACDEADNIYVMDDYGMLLRKIDQNKNVTTITNLALGSHIGAVDPAGNVLGVNGYDVLEVTANTNVLLIAGPQPANFVLGFTNGPGNTALFNTASSLCLWNGEIYVTDSGNQRIRSIIFNTPTQQIPAPNISISTYAGITITGNIGSTYEIQSSSDMENWTLSTTVLLPSNPYLWFDTNSLSGNKFYRALLLP